MREQSEKPSRIKVLGRDYCIKVPAGQAANLQAAAQLLNGMLAQTKAQSSALLGEKLLVMTALQLCAQQLELQAQYQRDIKALEAHVGARLEDIASLIRQG